MKTQSNSMLVGKLYKQIADIQLSLEVKQDVYNAALKADEPFEKVKALRSEIKHLIKTLKELEAHVTISNHLAEYSN